jgi:deoxycytidylate deaminase
MDSKQLVPKFIKKFMLIAKTIGEIENPCFSRHIGAIVVDGFTKRILGTGYNGPPSGTPHANTYDFLLEYFWPQLTYDQRKSLQYELGGLLDEQIQCHHEWGDNRRCVKCNLSDLEKDCTTTTLGLFIQKYVGKPICPRRLVGAKSGEQLHLCSCQHAERNAIINAARDLTKCVMYCWCGVPCFDCTGAIINAHISEVHCLKQSVDYSPQSRWLFNKANIRVVEWSAEELLS